MKTIFVAILLVGVALARPQNEPQQSDPNAVQILRYENDNSGLGSYRFAYETSDGSSRSESADIKNEGQENQALEVRGSYSWTAPDGQTYTVNYVADENGFHPEGEHIPKAPEAQSA